MPHPLSLSMGARWMAGAALSFTLMAVCARLLSPRIPVFEMIAVRSLFSILVTGWMMRRAQVSWRPQRPRLLLARSLFGFVSLTCYFEAVARIPLGNAVVLLYINPVVAGVAAALFLREPFRRGQWMATLFCLAGVALIARPSSQAPLLGSLFGLCTGVLSGLAYTMVRALNRSGEHPLRTVLSFPLMSLPLALLLGAGAFVAPTGLEWAWLVGLGVTTQCGQLCLTQGLRHEATARATQIGYLAPVLGMLLGAALGDGIPGGWSLVGSAVILVGLVAFQPAPARPPRPVG